MDVFILATERSWFLDFFRNIFAFIDSVVYSLIGVLFKTIFNLANFELVGLYEIFETRIYVILGIFMLFKVAVSLLTYLVNPDKISDKQEGASKLVTRIMVTLVMLISLPSFFNLATEFQNKLLPALPRLIIGEVKTSNSDAGSTSEATRVSEEMSSTMIGGFAHVDSDCSSSDGSVIESQISKPWDLYSHINDKCPGNSNIYKYDYLPIVSTIVGIIMCYVVFSLCITVAIRAFKLIILRMLAPIPIVSYINPKSSKDGMFSTWTKTFISTWSEVFILIGLIYFVVFIIDYMLSADAWVGFFNGVDTPVDAILLLAFLIIGLLMFARQAPKFVFDALGIKNKGSFTRMLGMGAAALGVGGTVASSVRARNEYDQEHGRDARLLRNVGASLFSGIAGASAAGNALLSSDKLNLRTGFDAQDKYNTRNLNRIAKGSTFTGRTGSMLSSLFTGQTSAATMKKRKANLDAAEKAVKDYKSAIESRFDGNDSYVYEYDFGDGRKAKFNWMTFDQNFKAANNGDQSALEWLKNNGFSKQEEYDEEYEETIQVPVQDGYELDGEEMVPKYRYETQTVKKTRKATRTVADLDTLRAKYEDIHKKGYSSFASDVVHRSKDANGADVQDSVVLGKLSELKEAVKGIQVDSYNKYGDKISGVNPVNLDNDIDYSDYGNGVKGTLGNISGTKRDLEQSEAYRSAIADSEESKK